MIGVVILRMMNMQSFSSIFYFVLIIQNIPFFLLIFAMCMPMCVFVGQMS